MLPFLKNPLIVVANVVSANVVVVGKLSELILSPSNCNLHKVILYDYGMLHVIMLGYSISHLI